MILNALYLFDNQSTTGDSIVINNVKGTMLILQVKCASTFEFKVKGSLNIDGATYNDLAAINLSTLSKVSSISTEGIYRIDISGCRKIKLNVSTIGAEALTVFGTVKEG